LCGRMQVGVHVARTAGGEFASSTFNRKLRGQVCCSNGVKFRAGEISKWRQLGVHVCPRGGGADEEIHTQGLEVSAGESVLG
jgi:hypothetical protein